MNKIVMLGNYPQEAHEFIEKRSEGRYEVVWAQSYADLKGDTSGEYIVLRVPNTPAEEVKTFTQARLFHRWGVGYNNVDIKAAGEMGVPVAITTGGNAQPVAEQALCLMLASFRHTVENQADAKRGNAFGGNYISDSFMINGRRVGILGLGAIGKRVARAVQGFGAEVVYFDVFRLPEEAEKELKVTYLPMEEVLKTSDIVSIHMPLLESTRGLINKDRLALMKKNALLVNTARGEIVNTEDLLEAVRERRIWGAALDTVAGEPLPADHPVFSADHVLVTPHVAGNTADNTINMATILMANIDTMERGEELHPRFIVNRQFLKK